MKVLIQDGDDWVRILVDGKVVAEGHDSLPHPIGKPLAEALGFEIEYQFGYFNDYGNFEEEE